jgi:hypothetical protein
MWQERLWKGRTPSYRGPMRGGGLILRTPRDTYQKAPERENFFLQGLNKGNLKVVSKGGLGQYVYWDKICT